jgi:hypothetical protein
MSRPCQLGCDLRPNFPVVVPRYLARLAVKTWSAMTSVEDLRATQSIQIDSLQTQVVKLVSFARPHVCGRS